jgi:hypothetical protein
VPPQTGRLTQTCALLSVYTKPYHATTNNNAESNIGENTVEHRQKVWVPQLDKQQRFFERHKSDDEEDSEVEADLAPAVVVQEGQVAVAVVEEAALAGARATLVGVVAVLPQDLEHHTELLLDSTDQGNERSIAAHAIYESSGISRDTCQIKEQSERMNDCGSALPILQRPNVSSHSCRYYCCVHNVGACVCIPSVVGNGYHLSA